MNKKDCLLQSCVVAELKWEVVDRAQLWYPSFLKKPVIDEGDGLLGMQV